MTVITTTIMPVAAAFAFQNADLVHDLFVSRSNYLEFEPTPEQFATIENLCSGSSMAGTFRHAYVWAENRSDDLHSEAKQYEEQGDGYFLPMGYCEYMANDQVVAYETTRGTVFLSFSDGSLGVMLPKSREFGFHHQAIALAMAGLSYERIDALFNLHRNREDGFADSPFADFESAFKERNQGFDGILLPLGFPAQQTWEEHLAEWELRKAKRGSSIEEYSLDDGEIISGDEEEY